MDPHSDTVTRTGCYVGRNSEEDNPRIIAIIYYGYGLDRDFCKHGARMTFCYVVPDDRYGSGLELGDTALRIKEPTGAQLRFQANKETPGDVIAAEMERR